MAKKTGPTPILFTLFLILMVGVSPAVADDIYVDGFGVGENYTSIQEAVNAANAGDTILVYPGTYYENVEVNKTVAIDAVSTVLVTPTTVGDSEYTIVPPPETTETAIEAANSEYPVFNVTSNGVTISGFIITGATGVGSAGICLLSDENEISNNLIVGNYYGVYMNESEGNNIFNNTVVENGKDGIFFDLSDSNVIENNTIIYNSYRGIFGLNSDDTELTNNEVTGNYYYYYSPEPAMEEPETFSEPVNPESSESKSKTCKKDSEGIELLGDSLEVAKGSGPVHQLLAKMYTAVSPDQESVETDKTLKKEESKDPGHSKHTQDSRMLSTAPGEEFSGCPYSSEIGIYLVECSNSNLTSNKVIYSNGCGIFTEGYENKLIGNNASFNSGAGIHIMGDGNNLVDNIASYNGEAGIRAGRIDWDNYDPFGNYIVYESNGNTIVNNTAIGNDYSGIRIDGSNNVLTDNTAVGSVSGQGIKLGNADEGSYSYDNELVGNNASFNCKNGIYIDGGSNSLTDNVVVENDYSGIRLGNADLDSYSDGNVLVGNYVSMNGYSDGAGIFIDGGSNELRENIVVENEKGISLGNGNKDSYSYNNVLIGNNVSLNNDIGIRVSGGNNTFIDNDVVGNDDNGIMLNYYSDGVSDHNVLTNNNVSLNDGNGIQIDGSFNVLTGNTVLENDGRGITLAECDKSQTSHYNELVDNYVSSNDMHGIFLSGSHNNLTNNEIMYNGIDGYNGINLYGNYNDLTGNTIGFSADNGLRLDGDYNTLAENIIVTNGFYDGDQHGIRLDGSHNALRANNVSDNSWDGIRVENGYDNDFEDNIINFNRFAGIRIGDSLFSSVVETFKAVGLYESFRTENSFVNNTVASNGYFGIYLSYSGGDLLEDNYVASNGFNEEVSADCEWPNVGICLVAFDDGTLKGNTLENNSYAGLFVEGSSGNTIYDNYFNNTNNVELGDWTPDNLWNIDKTEGANVVGGPYLGGNFWALPDGTGFSQNTTDADEDGICDLPYNVTEDEENIDYFPLAVAPEVEVEDEDDDSSGSGGTGGGIGSLGGGSTTYIPASTTGVTGEVETAQKKVVRGRETKLQFNEPKNGVSGIGFTSKQYSGVVIVRVEGTDGAEASGKPNGKVHRYMRILVGNEKFEGSDNIDEGTIEFRVPKSWLEENGIDPSEVTLNRYHDGAWTSLPTEMTGEGDEYYYFTATTPGFSLYAITGGDNETGAAGGNDVITPTEEEENETITGEEQTKEEESENESSPGFESAIAVLGILGSAFFVRKEMLK